MKKLCNCNCPFPCEFPVSSAGTMCDECGDWLMPKKANAEGNKRWQEAWQKALNKEGAADD